MQPTELNAMFRPLRGGWSIVAHLLAFAIVSAFVQVAAEIAGAPRHWAWALGMVCGFAAVYIRAVFALRPSERPWRSLAIHVLFFAAIAIALTGLFGARIVAPAP